MTDDDMTGPWVLALGTLALGVGAVTATLLRQRRDHENSPKMSAGPPSDDPQ